MSLREFENCWHPLASSETCGRTIVRAHSLQRATTIRSIADSTQHVLTFCPPRWNWDGSASPNPIGWKEASTFKGFCDTHDRELFAPIETEPFAERPMQCFLHCYRATCHELHRKRCVWDYAPSLHGVVDRGLDPQEQQRKQQEFRLNAGALGWAMIHTATWKQSMDTSLTSGSLDAWQFAVLRFAGLLEVVSTGVVSPNVDFGGGILQENLIKEAQSLAFATVPTEDGFSFVFCWRNDAGAPRLFLQSLLALPRNSIPDALFQFVFAYVENTFFSHRWWNSRRMYVQEHIAKLALLRHPYADPPQYLGRHVVQADLLSARFFGGTEGTRAT